MARYLEALSGQLRVLQEGTSTPHNRRDKHEVLGGLLLVEYSFGKTEAS